MPLCPHRKSCRLFQLQYTLSGITPEFLTFFREKFVKKLEADLPYTCTYQVELSSYYMYFTTEY